MPLRCWPEETCTRSGTQNLMVNRVASKLHIIHMLWLLDWLIISIINKIDVNIYYTLSSHGLL